MYNIIIMKINKNVCVSYKFINIFSTKSSCSLLSFYLYVPQLRVHTRFLLHYFIPEVFSEFQFPCHFISCLVCMFFSVSSFPVFQCPLVSLSPCFLCALLSRQLESQLSESPRFQCPIFPTVSHRFLYFPCPQGSLFPSLLCPLVSVFPIFHTVLILLSPSFQYPYIGCPFFPRSLVILLSPTFPTFQSPFIFPSSSLHILIVFFGPLFALSPRWVVSWFLFSLNQFPLSIFPMFPRFHYLLLTLSLSFPFSVASSVPQITCLLVYIVPLFSVVPSCHHPLTCLSVNNVPYSSVLTSSHCPLSIMAPKFPCPLISFFMSFPFPQCPLDLSSVPRYPWYLQCVNILT